MEIFSLKLSNEYMIKLIQQNQPFLITRQGIGYESYISAYYKCHNKVNTRFLSSLDNNAGIYGSIRDVELWCIKYIESISESNALATWDNLVINEQIILKPKNIPSIHTRVLEPFYLCSEGIIPWSHYTISKKILIISPFVDSIKKQNENNFQIFSDGRRLFLEGQEFVYYKTFNTSAGNHILKSWIEPYDIMCNEILKLDFDIALLGCGGYGLPLCQFIHKEMNKTAIYVGGGLQMIFGVMGRRWEGTPYWKDIIKTQAPKFIRPSESEIMKNCKRVENGCYW